MQIEVAVIGALVGFIISYFGFMRNRDKDVKKEATEKAVTDTKLNHIIVGVDSIKLDIKDGNNKFDDLSKNVIRIEEVAKSAHKRLDKMDKECVK